MKPNKETILMQRLCHASVIEGGTLLTLVAAGLPLKYWAGFPAVVTVLGALHGLAFLGFVALLGLTANAIVFTRSELIRLLVGACIPGGAFVNAALLQRKAFALA